MKPEVIRDKDPRAEEAIRRWDELRLDRSRHEADWEAMARLIRPQRGGFGLSDHTVRGFEKPLTSVPIIAANNFAAGLYGNISNPASAWFTMETSDPELNAWQPMAEWNDIVTARIVASFRPEISTFYSSATQAYADLSVFGNASGYDEIELSERRFIDVTLSLAEVVFDIDAHGRVCEVVRKYTLRPRAAVRQFHGRGSLPAKVHELAEKGSPDKLTFYQHVLRNEDFRAGGLSVRGKRWISRNVCEEGCTLISERGYDEMPFYGPRWEVDSGQTYGTGPGFIALASARLLHRMHDATIRGAQQASDPTLLAPDRDTWPLSGRVRPGEVIYGGVDPRGNPLLRPLGLTGGIALTVEEKRGVVEEIKDAFNFSLMSLQGRTGMTATEVMAIEEERMRLWAPHTGRIQEEFLARKVQRRFSLLWRAGQLPPPPEGTAGAALQVRYTSAAEMAMRARQSMAITSFVANIAPLAQVNPRYMERIDPDALIEALHEASPSLPARILRSREDADAIAQARVQQEQTERAMAMAQGGAGVLKDAAAAGLEIDPAMMGQA